MLTVTDLASGYGRIPIVHGISMQVQRGEILGIFGHNGMGKTTLLKTIAGHIRPTAGTLVLDGVDIGALQPSRRARLGIGYVPKGRMIFHNLSVLENLRMGAAAAAKPDAIIDEIVDDLPRLKPILKRSGGVLSGGEQQILALARCLCGRPGLVLLDEPTEGIQPSIVDEMVALLTTLKQRHHLTILLVEQKLSFLQRLSDRVLLIQGGLIKTELTKDDFTDTTLVENLMNTGRSLGSHE